MNQMYLRSFAKTGFEGLLGFYTQTALPLDSQNIEPETRGAGSLAAHPSLWL